MAPINQINTGEQDYQVNILSSWLATISVMAAMILSLVGIKIWWFKHRLTFEQNATQNGAAGGNQPMLKSYTRDKRTSQQIVDSVAAHGVFRKRDESELDTFERPKQLPPIRIPQRSQSATTLLLPPRARRGGNLTVEIPTAAAAAATTPYNIKESQSISALDQIVSLDARENSHQNQLETENSTTTPEPTAPERLFRKVNLPSERKILDTQRLEERRGTGFMPAAETVALDQWPVQVTESSNNTTPNTDWAPNAEDTWALSTEEISKSQHSQDNEQIWQEMGVAVDAKNLTKNLEEEFERIRDSYQAANEVEYLELKNCPINVENQKPNIFENEELVNGSGGKFEEVADFSQKHLVSYDDSNVENWQHFQQLHEPEYALKIEDLADMVEISKSSEFANLATLEEESTKHSEEFGQVHQNFSFKEQNANIAQYSQTKEIESNAQILEDFSHAEQVLGHDHTTEISNFDKMVITKTAQHEEEEEVEAAFRPFSPISNFEVDNQLPLPPIPYDLPASTQLLSSATAYVESIEELYDELSYENEHAKLKSQNAANIFQDEHDANDTRNFMTAAPKTSILKERLQSLEDADYVAPTAKTRKLKSQQKVTFDFNTEEYYLPESATEEDDKDEEEEAAAYDAEEYEEEEYKEQIRQMKARKLTNEKRQTAFYGQKYKFGDEDDEDDEDYDENVYEDYQMPEMPKIPPPPLPRTTTAPQPRQRATKLQNSPQETEENFYENATTWTANETSKSMRTTTSTSTSTTEQIFMQQQTSSALLFSSQIAGGPTREQRQNISSKAFSDEDDDDDDDDDDGDSWTAIQRQRRYKYEQQLQQQYQEFIEEEAEESAFKLKPQASPRLGQRGNDNNAARSPAPRHQRRNNFDEQEVGITEV